MTLARVASIFFKGSAILVGSLSVMRLLYRLGICEPPRLAIDPPESTGAPQPAPVERRLSLAKTIPAPTIPAGSPTTDDTNSVVAGVPG
jgi:hypothetical protein